MKPKEDGLHAGIENADNAVCPFCGHKWGKGVRQPYRGQFQAICYACGVLGPPSSTEEGARTLWNRRKGV